MFVLIDRWIHRHYRSCVVGMNMFFIAVSPYSSSDDAAEQDAAAFVEEAQPASSASAAIPRSISSLGGMGEALMNGTGDDDGEGDEGLESALYDHYLAKTPAMPRYQPTNAQTFMPITNPTTVATERHAASYEDVMDAYLDRVETMIRDDREYIGALTELDKALIIDPLNRRVHHLKVLVTEKIKRELVKDRTVPAPVRAEGTPTERAQPTAPIVANEPVPETQESAEAAAPTAITVTPAVHEKNTMTVASEPTLADITAQALRDAEAELLSNATRRRTYETDVASQLFVEEPVTTATEKTIDPGSDMASQAAQDVRAGALPKAGTVAEALAQLDPFEKKQIEGQAAQMKEEFLTAAGAFEKLAPQSAGRQEVSRAHTAETAQPAGNEEAQPSGAVETPVTDRAQTSAIAAATAVAPVQQSVAAVPATHAADDTETGIRNPVERYMKQGKRHFKKKNYALALITFSKAQEYDVHRVYEKELQDLVRLTKQRLEVMAA